jgi:hypothetical protein
MADVQSEALQRAIDANIDQLNSPDPAKRREAAYFLGEAAAADAVTALIDLYQHDDDRSVRQAAAYALGMFRAVEKNLKAGKQDRVVELLRQVEEQGKLGKRAPKRKWAFWFFALLVSLLILAALNLFLPELFGQRAADDDRPTAVALADVPAGSADRDAALDEIRERFGQVRADTENLQRQFQAVLGGDSLDCTAYFNNAGPYALNGALAGEPALASLVTQLNEVVTDLTSAKARYDQACFEDNPLPAQDVGPVFALLVPAVQALPTIEAALQAADSPATDIPVEPTATPAPTEAPTSTTPPTEPVALADPQRHLPGLYTIIDNMTGSRGANTLLAQYWTDALSAGVTDGCNAAMPAIPADYVLPPEDAQAEPRMAEAVTLLNTGLNAVRDGWSDFMVACSAGSLGQRAEAGLAAAQVANAAFQSAAALLDLIRSGI